MKFLLLDKIHELIPGKSAKGVKCWSLDNEIFQDHFPGFPTVPGVLITESMAQLAGVLIEHSYYAEYGNEHPVYPILSIIQKAKFRTFVSPGDQCFVEAEADSLDKVRGTARTKTTVNGEIVSEAVLSFLILGQETGMQNNRFFGKHDQYMQTILPEAFRK